MKDGSSGFLLHSARSPAGRAVVTAVVTAARAPAQDAGADAAARAGFTGIRTVKVVSPGSLATVM